MRRRMLPFYLSYAVGLVAPIVLGFVVYFRTTALAESEINARVEFALEQAAIDIESIYGDVQFIVSQAALSEPISALAETSFPQSLERYRSVLELVFNPAFIDNTTFSRFVTDYYLILPRPELVLGTGGILSQSTFYRYEFGLDGISEHEFFGEYLAPRFEFELRRQMTVNAVNPEPTPVILLLHALPGVVDASSRLMFVLDRRAIELELEAASFPEGSAIFVLDRSDTLIASFVESESQFDVQAPADPEFAAYDEWRFPDDAASFSVLSPEGSIRIVAHISREAVTSRVAFVRRTTLYIVVAIVAIGIALVVIFSRRNARPLAEVLSALQTEMESRPRPSTEVGPRMGSSLRYVERQLNRLVEHKHSLEDELDRQKPVLTSLILQSLLQGIRIQDEELRGLLARSGIRLNTGFRCCIVMAFDPASERVADDIYDEFALKKLLLEDLFESHIRGNLSFLYQSYDRLVLIHGADADDKALYHERLIADVRQAVDELNKNVGIDLLVGIGNPYYMLPKIRTSYEEACIAVDEYAPLGPDRFAVYSEYVDSHQSFYYPVELELKLLNATRQGSEQMVRSSMRLLRAENFERRSLGREPILILMGEIRATVAKINGSIEAAVGESDEDAAAFTQTQYGPESWEQCLADAENVLVALAVYFNERVRRSRSGIDPADVTAYLEQNFRDMNLSLTMIADAFGVSEKYFSRYFKDRFRINFHPYLENLRLSFVRDRLMQSADPIREIVREAGYASPATCSRAFKRKYGITPSEFRAGR